MKCTRSILKFSLETPIGEMIVTHCQDGLHSISQTAAINDSNFDPQPSRKVVILDGSLDCKQAQLCFEWLATYFNNPKEINNITTPKICVMSKDGSFSERVCINLYQNVLFGHIISYKKLAEMVGNPGASRAVGSAMSHNPLQLLVPCHRVLPSPDKKGNSKSGNYAFGRKNVVKQWLLKHEGQKVNGDIVMVKNNL